LLLVVIEFLCFYMILRMGEGDRSADLVAVFRGNAGRVKKGYAVANRCKARYLTLSPATVGRIAGYNRTFKDEPCYELLVEDRAETTFQNALLVGRLAREKQIRSVILVTNAVHMPRSYLLMRIVHLGSGIKVFPAPVEREAFTAWPWRWSRRQQKLVYNEMVELWGSLFELVKYRWDGELPQKSLKQNKVVSLLRRWVLFKIEKRD
jgi:uncharacterized SAM-binding protein YcdF (DUF218 family)